MNTHTLTDAQLKSLISDAVANALASLESPVPAPEKHTCEGTTQAGLPCKGTILVDGHFCRQHAPKAETAEPARKPSEQAPPAPAMPSLGTYGDVIRLKVGMSVDVRPVLTGDDKLDKKATNKLKWAAYGIRTVERVASHVVVIEDKSGHTYREDRTDAKLWTVTRIA